jgi:phage N-6-adenine-methyltransferase
MPMPQQRPGRSKQDYQTPPEFITAVKRKLGITNFDIDLAADATNRQAEQWYGLDNGLDSLTQPWKVGDGWNWLNPPYSNIRPWVEKAEKEAKMGAKTAVLIPASVGSNWWFDYVHQIAHVLLLNGRLTFVGCPSCYPKDCALLLYSHSHQGGYRVWPWQIELD